ncbi:HAD family hydrolase [Paracoccus sp. DMF-8]|uniref:HAD family hydrolase n=1 Tax=Paracoccus sp. DMF-8 TaxID=3019445 RepID=UPI0023E762EA|nr:HAD family hydrolase [Paracoccus sp. DMF-8]MDF3607043.1 HAD family hydrolase [Paracoccus sp. DMF-8]
MTPAPKLLVLDCDGVLIDSEIISARMLVAELANFGVSIDLGYVAQRFLGRSYPTVLAEIRRDFGIDLPPAFEDQYRERLLDAFRRELQVMPGVPQVLDALAIPFCVATSSSPRRAEFSLQQVGLWDRLRNLTFTASEVARGKPALDLFLHAASRMGVPPRDCLVIEDSLTGIRAARAAGMAVWRFTGGSHMRGDTPPEPDDARPDLHFADFADFFRLAPELLAPELRRAT